MPFFSVAFCWYTAFGSTQFQRSAGYYVLITLLARGGVRACQLFRQFEAKAFQGPWDEEPVWKVYKVSSPLVKVSTGGF